MGIINVTVERGGGADFVRCVGGHGRRAGGWRVHFGGITGPGGVVVAAAALLARAVSIGVGNVGAAGQGFGGAK